LTDLAETGRPMGLAAEAQEADRRGMPARADRGKLVEIEPPGPGVISERLVWISKWIRRRADQGR